MERLEKYLAAITRGFKNVNFGHLHRASRPLLRNRRFQANVFSIPMYRGSTVARLQRNEVGFSVQQPGVTPRIFAKSIEQNRLREDVTVC